MNNIVYIILGVLLIAAIIVLVIVLDSTKKSKTFQKISETDSLTGILNRSGEKKIRRLMTTDMGGMFCLLDIDNFKAINDGFGHGAGDQVLIAVADCMNRVFRERDIVMRLGGDEFAVYVPRVTDEEIGTAIVDRFVTEVDRLRIEAIDNQPIHISLGATFYRVEEGKDYETIYKRADTGCYNSKKMQGRSEYTFVLG